MDLTGTLDLKNNNLTGESVGSWNGSAYDGITGLIKSGRLTTCNATSGLTRLAVATARDAGVSSFDGFSVSPSDVLAAYTFAGDANLNGKVDADDYFQIDSHYNKSANAEKSFAHGDFDYDGVINGDGYALIDAAFASQAGGLHPAAPLAGASAVPELAGALTVAIAILLIGKRTRRNRPLAHLLSVAHPAHIHSMNGSNNRSRIRASQAI